MKSVTLQFGAREITVNVPHMADVLRAPTPAALADPAGAVRAALDAPLASPPLLEVARGRCDAAVVVSDNTRPVPYKGPGGLLRPIIQTLRAAGVGRIKIIVGCGNHRPMTSPELRAMLDHSAFQDGIEVINHVSSDNDMLRSLGRTARTADVTVNRHYLEADLKITTGLVEPHCMAGYSGGRKAICPGICGQSVTWGFHSARILADPNATTLVLDENPCHLEALEVARMAGCDFIANVTVDSAKRTTGVFCGELERAHRAAVEYLNTYVAIPIAKLYDVTITQAGEVGINHYQCVKAVLEGSRALKSDGRAIVLADLTDVDPIGNPHYKELIRLLTELGPEGYCQRLLSDDWTLVPDQWGPQVWARPFQTLGCTKNLFTCAPQLERCDDGQIPEVNVAAQTGRLPGESDVEFAQRMLQQTIDRVTTQQPEAAVLVLPDGPYAVPVLQ